MTDRPAVDAFPSVDVEHLLTPDDEQFLKTYPNLQETLTFFRGAEQTVIGHPETTDPYPLLLDKYAKALIAQAGPDAVSVVLQGMMPVLGTVGQSPSLRPYLDAYLFPCLTWTKTGLAGDFHERQGVVRAALKPLLSIRTGDIAEQIAGTILTLPELRVQEAPIQDGVIHYFGNDFTLAASRTDVPPPDHPATFSELELGVLLLRNKAGKPVGVVCIHPDRVSFDMAQTAAIHHPRDVFQTTLVRDLPGFAADADRFFADFAAFFDDNPFRLSPAASLRSWWKPDALPHTNAIPLEAKYYLWRLYYSSDQHERGAIAQFLRYCKEDAPWVIQTLEGNKTSIVAAAENLIRLHQAIEPKGDVKPLSLAAGVLAEIASLERFVVEAAAAVMPPSERQLRGNIQERINFLRRLTRPMTDEAVRSFAEAKTPADLDAGARFHGHGVLDAQEVVSSLQVLYRGDEIQTVPLDPNALPQLLAESARYPHAKHTYLTRCARWLTNALINQTGIPVEERRDWLRRFYAFVTSREVDIYQGEKAQQLFSGETEAERERLTNTLIELQAMGNLPEGAKCLILGSGPATRVEGPALERVRKQLRLGKIMALDMAVQPKSERWAGAAFVQGTFESLPFAPESVDLVLLWGSPPNNMTILREQLHYQQEIARILKNGGVLLHETGSPIPVRAINERWRAMQAYSQLYPAAPLARGLRDDYRQPTDLPGEPGALIFEDPFLYLTAELSGMEILSPTRNPVALGKLIADVQDLGRFRQISTGNPGGVAAPFILAGVDDDGLVNARAMYIAQRLGPPHPMFTMLFQPSFPEILAEDQKAG